MKLKINSQLAIVLANSNLLVAALLFKSDLGNLVFFYWVEMLIHGVFFICRLYLAVLYHPLQRAKTNGKTPLKPTDYYYLFILTIHYFAFIYGQYEGVHEMIGQPPALWSIIFTSIPLFISHFTEFKNKYLLNKAYLVTTPFKQILKVYQRVIFSTLWIMGSVLYLQPQRSQLATIAGILAIKTVLDLVSSFFSNQLES